MNIRELADNREQEVISWRRWLHAHPELSCFETATTAFITERLRDMDIEVQTFPDIQGCVGTIRGGHPGKTVMLRADIDALPIQEATGLPFSSENPGVMHACGHDCHTAMLLGAASVLSEVRQELHGTVKLIFQMGEEVARKSEEYVKRGVLDGVDAIFGMHVWPTMDIGFANFQSGERMACSDRFTIQILGKSSHGSAPHLGNDAILAAANAVMALQSLASRMNDPLNMLVVTVGKMHGGTKDNILCDHVELVGTVRTFDRDLRRGMPQRIENIVRAAANICGCTAECDYYFGPSPLINDDEKLVAIAQGAVRKQMGADRLRPLEKMTGAEDFSVYLEHIPGIYGYLGIRNLSKGIDCRNHHPAFLVDEDVLRYGTGVYAQFAVDYLNGQE